MKLTIEQALQQGVAAHREGKFQDAERLYRAILESQPGHPDANHNLGVLAVAFNKADAALPLFKAALEANPKIEQFWLSYIDALIKEQQFDNAEGVLEEAKKQGVDADRLNSLVAQLSPKTQKPTVGVNPPQELINKLLGHYQSGRLGEIEASHTQAIALNPHYSEAYNNLGNNLQELGRLDEAETSYKQAIALKPESAEAHNNLGNALRKRGRLDEAQTSYTRAIALTSDLSEIHYNLGVTLQDLGKLEDAEASYTQAIVLKSKFTKAYNNLGNTLKELGRIAEAEARYTQGIALNPDYAEVYNNLGVVLQDIGKLEEAESCYKQAITLNIDYAEAHRHLALMKKFYTKDEHYSNMLRLYCDEDISEQHRCHINFGLAKACEDLGDFEQAFVHYSEGNALRKKLLNYDINQDVELFERIKSNYPQIEKSSLEPDKFSKNLMPIFIVGMPRSGTTLVEQIISSHSRVNGAGELYFANKFGAGIAGGITKANNQSLLDFRHNYLKELQNFANGKLVVTDKMPQNFRYIGLLAAAFPEAKIVHVKRNRAAVCWANFKQYFLSKNIGYSYAIDDVIRYHDLYENLMDFWTKKLRERIYNLDYELLTVYQESETRQLIEYLGLDWDKNCLSPQNNTRSVATASSLQVRQKVYQGSSEQWKKYKPFLNGAFDDFLLP